MKVYILPLRMLIEAATKIIENMKMGISKKKRKILPLQTKPSSNSKGLSSLHLHTDWFIQKAPSMQCSSY